VTIVTGAKNTSSVQRSTSAHLTSDTTAGASSGGTTTTTSSSSVSGLYEPGVELLHADCLL